ncbi:unnamed protein product [Victoria cruziana]
MQGRDDGHSAEFNVGEHVMPGARMMQTFHRIAVLELGQIQAGAEVLAFAGDDHGLGGLGQLGEALGHGGHDAVADGIALVRATQADDGDRAAVFDGDFGQIRGNSRQLVDHANLIAIDIHTHAEVSCWNPFDNYGEEYDRAADKYFGSNRRPTIAETIAYYRERKIGLVMFTVDSESKLGRRRIPNEEIAQAARENSDMMMAFASIDPHKGKMGAREAERLIKEEGVKGFKFHPTVQGYHPYDKMAWPIYEVINAHKLPAIFHTGHSGIGSGMRCGGGLRLEYSNPMHLDDVAIDFPDMQIVMAHPSFPWQDEALSVATHKPNVWIDLSGWSPKYFPKQLVQYANTLLKDRILFGSDYPLITPERWMKDFEVAGFKPEVMPGILKGNAAAMISNFEQVHNYYERLVFEEVLRRGAKRPDLMPDVLGDIACVALNRLPARYVRHDVDLMFYLTEHERHAIELSLEAALDFAFTYVTERAARLEA